ncbi:16S rRNA (cytidine(1402)-2'-O)-methyltransferase [Paracoccus pacificus]|uniref:Ribosomal RNA small subunit methyltransferase I n=1 Tax=Paracoccus pacificus TaxID=1463598 RepID=A0ABW4R404_9RHOB
MAEAAPLRAGIEAARLDPGLYLVATPIGAARDITLRALDTLNSADILAAEDTRTMRHLMDIHGIPLRGRRILAYHDHNADRHGPAMLAAIGGGKSVAYASDAGTPLVSDPGYRLGRDAIDAGLAVHAVPGASAMLAGLTVSGLPSDRFLFAGFPPTPLGQRRSWLEKWSQVDATLIFFESPRRVKQTLELLCETGADGRNVAVGRELTKRFEEVFRGTVAQVSDAIPDGGIKGEVVVILDRAGEAEPDPDRVRKELQEAVKTMTKRDAAAAVAQKLGLPRREVYQIALQLGEG